MSNVDMENEISKLRRDGEEKLQQAEGLKRMLAAFPDLKKYTARFNVTYFCSKSVNAIATDFTTGHSCGCCDDAPFQVHPYIKTTEGRIYSDPPIFTVGQRHYDCGDVALDGWQDRLRHHGIPEAIIERVSLLLRSDETEESDEDHGS